MIGTILLVVLGIAFFWGVGMYNSLLRLMHRTEEAWQDIEVQLKRRYDLIPNLVETVKGYAKHEEGTLTKVIEARNSAMKAGGTMADQAASQNMITDALKSIFALSEAYPDLKANQNFLHLQQELTDTENKIQAARRFYNANVRDLSIAIDQFPGNIIANMFHFAKKEYFDLPDNDAAQENVAVKF
ncbi:MAG TPA: LemA family protein [Candidatus Paceibacterota bacterium]|nr:LemA family protein [Candidatus Paceibacterota bacterium]